MPDKKTRVRVRKHKRKLKTGGSTIVKKHTRNIQAPKQKPLGFSKGIKVIDSGILAQKPKPEYRIRMNQKREILRDFTQYWYKDPGTTRRQAITYRDPKEKVERTINLIEGSIDPQDLKHLSPKNRKKFFKSLFNNIKKERDKETQDFVDTYQNINDSLLPFVVWLNTNDIPLVELDSMIRFDLNLGIEEVFYHMYNINQDQEFEEQYLVFKDDKTHVLRIMNANEDLTKRGLSEGWELRFNAKDRLTGISYKDQETDFDWLMLRRYGWWPEEQTVIEAKKEKEPERTSSYGYRT